jgi:hypothetical protein
MAAAMAFGTETKMAPAMAIGTETAMAPAMVIGTETEIGMATATAMAIGTEIDIGMATAMAIGTETIEASGTRALVDTTRRKAWYRGKEAPELFAATPPNPGGAIDLVKPVHR